MYRLLRLLFIGRWELPKICDHKWIEDSRYDYNNSYEKGIKIVSKCEYCGEIYDYKVSSN